MTSIIRLNQASVCGSDIIRWNVSSHAAKFSTSYSVTIVKEGAAGVRHETRTVAVRQVCARMELFEERHEFIAVPVLRLELLPDEEHLLRLCPCLGGVLAHARAEVHEDARLVTYGPGVVSRTDYHYRARPGL